MDIYQDKIYDIKVISYMKSLTKDIPINPTIRQQAIDSVLNGFAVFLNVNCHVCNKQLIDPTGIIKNKTRNALCGNCGYKSYIIK